MFNAPNVLIRNKRKGLENKRLLRNKIISARRPANIIVVHTNGPDYKSHSEQPNPWKTPDMIIFHYCRVTEQEQERRIHVQSYPAFLSVVSTHTGNGGSWRLAKSICDKLEQFGHRPRQTGFRTPDVAAAPDSHRSSPDHPLGSGIFIIYKRVYHTWNSMDT